MISESGSRSDDPGNSALISCLFLLKALADRILCLPASKMQTAKEVIETFMETPKR
jgi:hypothetical protein